MHASLSQPPRWSPWWAAALAAFVLLQSLLMAATTAPGLPPDEWAHLSYVRDVADGRPVPDYAEGRIRESTQGNYLSHPPLYYSLLGAATAVAGLEPFTDLRPLRMASAGFVGLGFLLWLLVGRALGLPLAGAVLVTDNGSNPDNLTDDATITVNLNDVNEAPIVDPATFPVVENSANGTSVGTVTFNDQDSGQTHTFEITAGDPDGAFTIDSAIVSSLRHCEW